MVKIILVTFTTLATLATAQSPLLTLTGGTNSGNSGGGLYFDLQVHSTITITQISALTGSPTTAIPASNTPIPGPSILEIWLGPSTYVGNVTNANLWTPVATATGNVAMTTMVPFTLTTPLCLGPGNYGVALKSVQIATGGNVIWGHGYTNGGTCSSTTVPGSCTSPASLFTNNELTLRAGAAQNSFLSGGIFTPRVFNGQIHYTLGGSPIAVAAWENYGIGCNRFRTSFHELFPNPASLDVSNTSYEMTLNGNGGYTFATSTTPFTAPSPTATVLTFVDGNSAVLASSVLPGPISVPILYPQAGTLQLATDLEINADGYISPTTNTWTAPAVSTFLSAAARWAPHWKNMNALGGGTVTIEYEASTNALVISWNAVVDNGYATTNSFQIAFMPNSSVQFRYGAMSTNGGGSLPVVIGWSHGSNALSNEVDISAAGFSSYGTDNAELLLAMNGRPRLGTTPAFVATNLPVGSPFGLSMLDFVQVNPGVNLAGFGAPDCFQYTGAAVVQIVFPSSGQLSQAFPIPNSTAFNGVLVFGQMAALAPGQNPLGLVFSNGTRMFMGSL